MTTYDSLSGRTALVTGAASGIGRETAALLARSGARVALLSRRPERLTELAEKLAADGAEALAVPTDVTDADAVRAAVDRVHEVYGRLDLVVNNAGVMLPNPIVDGRADEWQRMVDTNVAGVLSVVRATTADLVAVSSIGAHVVFPGFAVYGATKAMVTHLSASLRAELGPLDVRVTTVEPGLTATELADHVDNAGITAQVDRMVESLGTLNAAEVADLIGYATSRARHVNLRHVVVLPTRQA